MGLVGCAEGTPCHTWDCLHTGRCMAGEELLRAGRRCQRKHPYRWVQGSSRKPRVAQRVMGSESCRSYLGFP